MRSIDFVLHSILYIIFLGNSLGYSAPRFLLLTPPKIYPFFLEWTEDSGQLDTLFFLFNITIEANCTINALLTKNPVIIQAEHGVLLVVKLLILLYIFLVFSRKVNLLKPLHIYTKYRKHFEPRGESTIYRGSWIMNRV